MNLFKYRIKYLELVFVSTKFEITTLSVLTSQIFIGFLQRKIFLLLLFLSKSQHDCTIRKLFSHYFLVHLYDHFLRMYYKSSDLNLYEELI